MAWRVPDPADLDGYLPYVVLAEVLTDGDASRLQERMVLRTARATSISGYLGLLGDPLDARDPTPLLLEVHHPEETSRRHRRRRPSTRSSPGWPPTASSCPSSTAPSPA